MSIQNKKGIKILLCPDKFKGSLTSKEASEAIKCGIQRYIHTCGKNILAHWSTIAIADGGDGSAEIIEQLYNAQKITAPTCNALGDNIDGEYLMYSYANKVHAFIEMAKICGLAMLEVKDRNPLYTTTYGLGTIIKDATSKGAEVVTLSIGGSATNDGGIGLLQALGVEFSDSQNNILRGSAAHREVLSGKDLEKIKGIAGYGNLIPDNIEFRVICDVSNPLLGENGATYVYGPQKGADEDILKQLESGMENFAHSNSQMAHFANIPGAGAAGGVGFATTAYLGAKLLSGWRFFAEITKLQKNIEWADLVITGEGKIDSQSLQGKVIDGVMTIANSLNKKTVAFCGICNLNEQQLSELKCYQISSLESNPDVCMSKAYELLEQLSFNAAADLLGN